MDLTKEQKEFFEVTGVPFPEKRIVATAYGFKEQLIFIDKKHKDIYEEKISRDKMCAIEDEFKKEIDDLQEAYKKCELMQKIEDVVDKYNKRYKNKYKFELDEHNFLLVVTSMCRDKDENDDKWEEDEHDDDEYEEEDEIMDKVGK